MRTLASGLLCLLMGLLAPGLASAEDWLPISPEELQMKRLPEAPAAAAIYLYRQVDRDDSLDRETRYNRIKILNEEGLRFADVQIEFEKGVEQIGSITARTIRPDGSTVNFDGTVYEKPVAKARQASVFVKSFKLPDVQVGSIIEYRYTTHLRSGWIYDSHWILSEDLFTRHAKFSLEPYRGFELNFSWPNQLPPGTAPPKFDHGRVTLESSNIPAFATEEFMPPENELRYRVDFIYEGHGLSHKDQASYWKEASRYLYDDVHSFLNQGSAMRSAVAQIVQPGDTPEQKLRKLYARVAQIRNYSYETEEEREAGDQKLEAIHDVADVWKKGYGTGNQITLLYLGLLQAAGFDAYPVMISTRDQYFFYPEFMNSGRLNTQVVLVKLDGKDLFLDPGVPYTPYGMLPWAESALNGLRLERHGGSWLTTSQGLAADSRVLRKADLAFDHGTLKGKVTVTYTGLEAATRRVQERSQDSLSRQRYLENELQGAIPTGAQISLTNKPDWSSWDDPLVAEYDLEIPGWCTPAGHRMLLAVGLFGREEKDVFQHAARIRPLYFEYRYEHSDDVTINVPPSWTIDSTPKDKSIDLKSIVYQSVTQTDHQSLHITRDLTMNMLLIDPKYYEPIRRFYQQVRTSDEDQVVVSNGADVARQ